MRRSGLVSTSMLVLSLATCGLLAQVSQDDLAHALKGKRMDGVRSAVDGGTVTLTGSVSLLIDKTDADKKVRKLKGVTNVQDNIEVNGGEVSDADLMQKLGKGLTYDRIGYGTTAFNAINLQVKDGVVRLSGMVFGPPDKDSAIGLVENTKGVRGLVDDLKIAPLSPLDNRIRLEEERTIYGYAQFTKYAINPAKPIRIVVTNGHVTLVGAVDSQADKEVAGIRAQTVSGVFSVVNDLQVTGSHPE